MSLFKIEEVYMYLNMIDFYCIEDKIRFLLYRGWINRFIFVFSIIFVVVLFGIYVDIFVIVVIVLGSFLYVDGVIGVTVYIWWIEIDKIRKFNLGKIIIG